MITLMFKLVFWVLIFGAGFFTGRNWDSVKDKAGDLSSERLPEADAVLEKTSEWIDHARENIQDGEWQQKASDLSSEAKQTPKIIRTWILEQGDSAKSLCLRFYNDARYADALLKFNGLSADDVKVGRRVTIPELSELSLESN